MKTHWQKMGVFALGILLAAALRPPRLAFALPSCDTTTLQGLANGTSFAITITFATSTTTPVAFCDVKGDITTAIPSANTVEFELGLPAAFNGRLLFLGGGGFNGYIPAGVVDSGVSEGYATAYTDSGHESVFASNSSLVALSALDGSWGLLEPGNVPNTAAQVGFSYLGVHASTVVAQSLTTGYYDGPLISYFDGCSTGGREALVEAQLYPDDYNGIVAGDPAISDPIAGFNWNDQSLVSSPDAYLPPSAVAILDTAVTAACDGSDGVIDGLIEDPRLCRFDPASIECGRGKTSNCLTAAQVATVKAIQTGARAEDGTQLYPGYTLSNPGGSDGWTDWITGVAAPTIPAPADGEPWGLPPDSLATAPLQWSFQDQFLKYFVFNDPAYDSLTFDFNGSDVAMLEEVVARYGGNGEDTNLSPFFANGGKLIMYHGWSDPALTPFVSVDYYSAVAKTLGGGFGHLQNNARLFMVPGMHHCTGGPGPYDFDPLTPLIGWVEDGVAPDRIIGTVPAGPQAGRTFPLCPYPSLAVYQGGGVDDAANWVCKAHTNHRFFPGHHP